MYEAKPISASTLSPECKRSGLSTPSKVNLAAHALEQLQFFSSEKIIFLPDFFRRIVPFLPFYAAH